MDKIINLAEDVLDDGNMNNSQGNNDQTSGCLSFCVEWHFGNKGDVIRSRICKCKKKLTTRDGVSYKDGCIAQKCFVPRMEKRVWPKMAELANIQLSEGAAKTLVFLSMWSGPGVLWLLMCMAGGKYAKTIFCFMCAINGLGPMAYPVVVCLMIKIYRNSTGNGAKVLPEADLSAARGGDAPAE